MKDQILLVHIQNCNQLEILQTAVFNSIEKWESPQAT